VAKFTDALKFWSKPLTRGVRAITGNLDEQEEGQLRQEQERLFQSILNTTQPFRMGANTLVQNYGPAFRVLTGGDPLTPGPVEQFTREALTPEEQDYLERKPYMAALKSSVGMGSSLMPFTSRAVPAATLGARTAQIAGRGLLEGLAGGFGYSREGKELQDTLIGGGIGMGGELLGNYVFDPSYRGMVNQGFQDANTGMYQAALQLGKGDTTDSMLEVAQRFDNGDDFYEKMGSKDRKEFVEAGLRGREQYKQWWEENVVPKTPTLETLNPTGGVLVEYDPQSRMNMELGENITTLDKTLGGDPEEMITIYRGAPKSQGRINPGDYITTNFELAKSYAGEGRVISQKVRLGDILDDVTEPLGEEYIYRPDAWKSIFGVKGQTLAQEGLTRVREKIDGRDIEYITQRMDGEDRKVMTDFIDNTRLKKGNINIEIEARRMAEVMGLNPDVSNSKLANLFQRILEFSPYRSR